MRNTPVYAFPFPESPDHTRTWEYWQALAERVEAVLSGQLSLGAGLRTPAGSIVAGSTANAGQFQLEVDRLLGGVPIRGMLEIAGGNTFELMLIVNAVVKAQFQLNDQSEVRVVDSGAALTRPIPFAQAIGAASVPVNNSAAGNLAVTFPTGRFTQAPIIVATANNYDYNVAATAVTATGCTITVASISAFVATTTVGVHYHAQQMTRAAAAG